VSVRSDELTENHMLRIERMHHGNVKVSSIDADFVQGADYSVLAAAATTFKGLIGDGAFIHCPTWPRSMSTGRRTDARPCGRTVGRESRTGHQPIILLRRRYTGSAPVSSASYHSTTLRASRWVK
jgi:hypothetical protein